MAKARYNRRSNTFQIIDRAGNVTHEHKCWSREDVRQVLCPECKAPAGEPCRRLIGTKYDSTKSYQSRLQNHLDRVIEYDRALEAGELEPIDWRSFIKDQRPVVSDDLSPTAVLQVICPTCGAEPEERCFRPGNELIVVANHTARVEAYVLSEIVDETPS